MISPQDLDNIFKYIMLLGLKNHMDRYSARITSHIQNKETATHERNTELTCVRGCDVTKNQKVRIDYGRNGQGSS